jgi:hypothetical protein
LILTALGVHASDNELERATLRGVTGITVLVEGINPDAVKDGLTTEQIQTDVELHLRKAGVNVLTSSPTYLYVNAHALKGQDAVGGIYVYNCEVSLHQPVVVAATAAVAIVPTWSASYLGLVGRNNIARSVRDEVADLVDQFLNAYLAANWRVRTNP